MKQCELELFMMGEIVLQNTRRLQKRICLSNEIINNAKKIICIDHHASNEHYGDFNYIDIDASSTCELVYNFLKRFSEVNNLNIIDEKIATCYIQDL